jgi:hypothetical protein
VGLLDGDTEEPKSKLRRYILSGMVFALLMCVGVWWMFRFHTEKKTVESFLEAVVAGDTQLAYRIWKPQPSYTYQDFLADWGPQGTYGPVRSYRLETAQQPSGASGVIVVVELSPFEKFPENSEQEKLPKLKEVRLWVERGDQSLSFAPSLLERRTIFR